MLGGRRTSLRFAPFRVLLQSVHRLGGSPRLLVAFGIPARLFPGLQSHRTPVALDQNRAHAQLLLAVEEVTQAAPAGMLARNARASGSLAKPDEKRKQTLPGYLCLLPDGISAIVRNC